MARKTVEVSKLVQWANQHLKITDDWQKDQRWGVIGLVERALHETDNYKGFNYLSREFECGADGHRYLKDGYDDTRRYYHYVGE